MKLKEAQEQVREVTKSLSDVNRTLCLSGIAVVWIFAIDRGPGLFQLRAGFLLALSGFVLALLLDLVHYFWSSATLSRFYKTKLSKLRAKHNGDIGAARADEFTQPRYINTVAQYVFYGKVITNVLSYIVLVISIISYGRLSQVS